MFATVDIPAPFFGGGGVVQKVFSFSLIRNKKASFKGIYGLNGVHILVFFNTESLNARATHLNIAT